MKKIAGVSQQKMTIVISCDVVVAVNTFGFIMISRHAVSSIGCIINICVSDNCDLSLLYLVVNFSMKIARNIVFIVTTNSAPQLVWHTC